MLSKYRIAKKKDGRFYIQKRKNIFWWKVIDNFRFLHFAENYIFQKLMDELKKKNTRLVKRPY